MKLLKTLYALATAVVASIAMTGDLTVLGTGTVKRQPDTMEVAFTVSATDKDMATARRLYDERNTALAATLRAAGIDKSEVAEDGMGMARAIEWEGGKFAAKGTYVYRFWNGYTITAKLDRERLAKVNAALIDCEAISSLDVNFKVLDMAPLRNEARVRAVANAREIAESIAAAAGVSLGEIDAIVYGVGNDSNGVYLHKMAESGADSIECTTEIRDIEATDTVRIKWKVK